MADDTPTDDTVTQDQSAISDTADGTLTITEDEPEPFDHYDELTVDEVISTVENENMDTEMIKDIIAYEESHKNRSTLLSQLKNMLPDNENGFPEPEIITVIALRQGYIGGHWFDEAGERREVEKTIRVQRAIDAGDLRVVG